MENFIVVRVFNNIDNVNMKKVLNINLMSEVVVLSPTSLSILMNNSRTHTVFIDDNPILKKLHSDLTNEI